MEEYIIGGETPPVTEYGGEIALASSTIRIMVTLQATSIIHSTGSGANLTILLLLISSTLKNKDSNGDNNVFLVMCRIEFLSVNDELCIK